MNSESRNFLLVFLLLTFPLSFVFSQNATAYQFYTKKGKKVKFERMVNQLLKYDVVLFGENHDNSINHWLELQLTKALYSKKGKDLILGAEMFERDNQSQLNAFLAGELKEKDLKDSIRLWNNYTTDYHPLIDFAKTHHLKFIATNIPRKYASQVYKEGLKSLDFLPANEKKWMMKLPVIVDMETPGYTEMLEMMFGHVEEGGINFVAAQAVKDATMAESILDYWSQGKLFLHYNGNYHSKEFGGIYWYLKKQNPHLKIAVISVFESEENSVSLPKDAKLTEFNLVTPSDMTKTY
jgi:uncharacterized iron-regulated protein